MCDRRGNAAIGRARKAAVALVLMAAAPAGRVPLGQFGRWGAFRDADPVRCFAIAQPVSGGGDARPSLAIASWPKLRAHAQLHVRFSRIVMGGATIELGGRAFALMARGAEGWAMTARDDARVAGAMRGGGMLQVKAVDERGHHFRDLYPLDGAASAIDAMRLSCLAD